MKKNISIILNILLVVLLIGIAYGWMQTEPSMGENIEYNRDFYITDSDIDVKLYALVNNTYVLQGQQNDDALINLEEMYPGKIQRYRFELINKNDVAAKVKIIFTEITGNINLMKNYLKISATNPEMFSFMLNDRLEHNEEDDRYFFDFSKSVTIPANSSLNYYWNLEINIYDKYDFTDIKNASDYISSTDTVPMSLFSSTLNNFAAISSSYGVIKPFNFMIKMKVKNYKIEKE